MDPKILDFQEKLKTIKSLDELFGKEGLITDLLKNTVQNLLEAEMESHLGYPKNLKILAPKGVSNKRNGSYPKTLRTSLGEAQVHVPRDREGAFKPMILPKYQSKTNELEQKIISMYGKGMTVRDLNAHLSQMYGIDVTDPMISQITDKVLPLIQEWQNRPLEGVYCITYLDALHFKVREDGRVKNKAAYLALGINSSGEKDILGIWIGEEEGAKFWLQVLTDLQTRGVNDLLIVCCDNLKGFSEAIKSVFPQTIIQKCVIHQIRNSLKYIASKDKKKFMADLKNVYRANTKQEAETHLEALKETWGSKYQIVLRSWENNWEELSAYFQYSPSIRKMIYTTNAIEGLNRQIRKVTKNKTVFPTRTSLEKMLYLATQDIMKKWSKPVQNWPQIIAQLAILFPERLLLSL